MKSWFQSGEEKKKRKKAATPEPKAREREKEGLSPGTPIKGECEAEFDSIDAGWVEIEAPEASSYPALPLELNLLIFRFACGMINNRRDVQQQYDLSLVCKDWRAMVLYDISTRVIRVERFKNQEKMLPATLQFCQQLPNLVRLKIYHGFTHAHVSLLPRSLIALKLCDLDDFGLEGIDLLCARMTNLKTLTLKRLRKQQRGPPSQDPSLPALEDLVVQRLFSGEKAVSSTLTSFALNTGYRLTEKGLEYLACNNPFAANNLVALKLYGELTHFGADCLANCLPRFASLRVLTFCSKFLSLSEFELRFLPASLEEVNLYNQKIVEPKQEDTDDARQGLPSGLERLRLSHCHNLATTLGQHLGPSLTHIEIEIHDQEIVLQPATPTTKKVVLDDRGVFVDTSRLSTRLRRLTLKGYSAESVPPLPRTVRKLGFVQYEFGSESPLEGSPAGLRKLELTRGNITDAMLQPLASLESLQCVKLRHSTNLKGVGLKFLPPSITQLDITLPGLTDGAVVTISQRLPNLRRLSLFGCGKLTDLCATHIGRLTALEDLTISACAGITTAGLKHALVPLTKLQRLNLSSMKQCTNTVLTYLDHLPRLRDLNVMGSGIDPAKAQQKVRRHNTYHHLK